MIYLVCFFSLATSFLLFCIFSRFSALDFRSSSYSATSLEICITRKLIRSDFSGLHALMLNPLWRRDWDISVSDSGTNHTLSTTPSLSSWSSDSTSMSYSYLQLANSVLLPIVILTSFVSLTSGGQSGSPVGALRRWVLMYLRRKD